MYEEKSPHYLISHSMKEHSFTTPRREERAPFSIANWGIHSKKKGSDGGAKK